MQEKVWGEDNTLAMSGDPVELTEGMLDDDITDTYDEDWSNPTVQDDLREIKTVHRETQDGEQDLPASADSEEPVNDENGMIQGGAQKKSDDEEYCRPNTTKPKTVKQRLTSHDST
jgi:hypothetical protein